MAKSKRRRHRNRAIRKLRAKHARWARIMVAPLINSLNGWSDLRKMMKETPIFTVEPMTPEELAFYENDLKGVDLDTLEKW